MKLPSKASGKSSRPGLQRRRHASLQMRFQITLSALFLFFCAQTAYLIYTHEKTLLKQNAMNKSHLVMAAVESTRAYVRDVLRPRMFATVDANNFILEAMSTSYITRSVMDRFNESLPEYRYRRVSVNARNPMSRPSLTEMALIDYFRNHPNQCAWQGIRDMDGTTGFIHARPVYMKASCLRCHGKPGNAPGSLLALYGDKRGFGFKEGDLAGIMAVSTPVSVALQKIRGQALSVFWVSIMLLTCLYVTISYVFNRMVVRSLAGILDLFRNELMETPDQQRFGGTHTKVEIHELTQTARDMTTHLRQAREALKQHAELLEVRVADRTRDLEKARARLSVKVAARDRELQILNRITELITKSSKLDDLLPAVLAQTLALIPAEGAGIYLLVDNVSQARLHMACQRNAGQLDPVIRPQTPITEQHELANLPQAIWTALGGSANIFACRPNDYCLNIPLSCRGRVLGVMTFVGVDFHETSAEQQTLLQSIGHQIGITVESLQNIAALVRNKDLLQSVAEENVWGILRYTRDITLEKQVEQRIQQIEKMAALGQLAAGMAHEINNPMSIILCYTDLLRRQLADDGQVRKDVETIEKQARHCQRIVSDLLNFSRTRVTAPRSGQVNEVVREVAGMLHHQFSKKGTEFHLRLAEDIPLIPMDMDKMKQVFLNLFMNAFQAMDGKKGNIQVATTLNAKSGTIDIAVRDNGSGIPAEIAEKIFDPFFSTKKSGEGTGLGLSVSYGIVSDHGGKITASASTGRRTQFVVSLPVMPLEEAQP